MAFCTSCGSELKEGQKFCTNCGAMVTQAPAAPQPPAEAAGIFAAAVQSQPEEEPVFPVAKPEEQPQPWQAPGQTPVTQARQPQSGGDFVDADVASHKGMSVLAYLSILLLIPLLAAKDSPYARFHVNQGLVLLIAELVFRLIGKAVSWIGTLGGIFCFVLMIIGIVNAARGKFKELPLIGKIRILR